MNARLWQKKLTLLLWTCLTVLVLMGCATTAPTVTTGPFAEVSRLESELRRGVSTKMDVQRVIGTPKGIGGSILPTDPREREVWLYDDIEILGMERETGGVLRGNVRQQILLIFFDKGVFDGFMWYSNAGVFKGD